MSVSSDLAVSARPVKHSVCVVALIFSGSVPVPGPSWIQEERFVPVSQRLTFDLKRYTGVFGFCHFVI